VVNTVHSYLAKSIDFILSVTTFLRCFIFYAIAISSKTTSGDTPAEVKDSSLETGISKKLGYLPIIIFNVSATLLTGSKVRL
jgi:hypothetical protein